MTITVSIFADLGQGCGGRDVEISVSDIIGYYILKQEIVNGLSLALCVLGPLLLIKMLK